MVVLSKDTGINQNMMVVKGTDTPVGTASVAQNTVFTNKTDVMKRFNELRFTEHFSFNNGSTNYTFRVCGASGEAASQQVLCCAGGGGGLLAALDGCKRALHWGQAWPTAYCSICMHACGHNSAASPRCSCRCFLPSPQTTPAADNVREEVLVYTCPGVVLVFSSTLPTRVRPCRQPLVCRCLFPGFLGALRGLQYTAPTHSTIPPHPSRRF